jgi:hypothetical protein
MMAIKMSRKHIRRQPEIQRKARQRAPDMAGQPRANPSAVFDLGSSGGSDIASDKDAMLAEAFLSTTHNRSRRSEWLK